LGFLKDDRMTKYYLNGGDAFRLKFWVDRYMSPQQAEEGPNSDLEQAPAHISEAV